MSPLDLVRLAYLVVLLISCAFALRSGGRPEKQGAVIFLVGSFLSYPAATVFGSNWQSAELGILTVDIAVLGSYTYLALRCDRFWPLWITGFHLVAVVTHLATMVDAQVVPRAYSMAQPFWAYPMLLTLIVGTIVYRRNLSRDADFADARSS